MLVLEAGVDGVPAARQRRLVDVRRRGLRGADQVAVEHEEEGAVLDVLPLGTERDAVQTCKWCCGLGRLCSQVGALEEESATHR